MKGRREVKSAVAKGGAGGAGAGASASAASRSNIPAEVLAGVPSGARVIMQKSGEPLQIPEGAVVKRITHHDYTSNTPTVSCIVVSRGDRIKFLEVTKKCFIHQNYGNILEWIFINGSQSEDEARAFDEYVNTTLVPVLTNCMVAPWIGKKFIGAYRNQANTLTNGELTVCFDDDDYYYPTRIKHTVEVITRARRAVAGCENHYVYDFDMGMLCKYPELGGMHAANNSLAYATAFGKSHKYDETVWHAEEPSFLNDELAIQLNYWHTTLQFSHFGNTYNKRKLLLESVIRREGLSPISSTEPTDKVLTDILKDTEFIEAMRAVSSPTYTEEPEYDIVYYCGFFQPDWNPEDKALGGSEQAVVHLSEEWARKGKKVAVYAALTSKTKLTVNGVDYFPAYLFPFSQKQKTLILWRISGCFRLAMDLPIKADQILCDFHDNFDGSGRFLPKYLHKVDKVMFKSNFHADCFDQIVTKLPAEKRCVVMNGVRVEEFESRLSDPPRDPYRFVYASSYDRGLLWMIHGLWKHIQEMEPRAELHVYYGIHSMPDAEQRKMLLDAFAGMNIMDHGRQPLEIIRREKYRAAFHLYPTVSAAETDCITIRESLITGCVPILSNVGVMKERDGFHIDFDIRDPETLKKPAADIVELMRNGARMEALRKEFAESKTIVNWETVAQRWMELFGA